MNSKTVIVLCVLAVGISAIPYCKVPPSNKRNWRVTGRPPRGPPPPPPPRYQKKAPLFAPLFDWRSPPVNQPGRPLIVLFEHENHRGLKYEQLVGPRCYDLPNVMNDRASSVNTNGRCVLVCMDKGCKRCKKMKPGTPGHYKLSEIAMDDVITSLKPCGDIYE